MRNKEYGDGGTARAGHDLGVMSQLYSSEIVVSDWLIVLCTTECGKGAKLRLFRGISFARTDLQEWVGPVPLQEGT